MAPIQDSPQQTELSPVVSVDNVFKHGIYSILLAPDSNTYHISLIGTPEGYLPMQYYARDIDGKLYTRIPGGLQPQTWFVLENTTDNSYMIVKSDDHAHWELSNSKPGTQVLCEGGHGDDITKIIDRVIRGDPLSKYAPGMNQNAFWKLIPVTNMGAQPLETGQYSIKNVANGLINSAGVNFPGQAIPVVGAPSPALWGIKRLGGYEYEVTYLGDPSSLEGEPANEMNGKLFLASGQQPEKWLIHPLLIPNVYMIFSTSKAAAHWQLNDNKPGTQVTVNAELPPFSPFKGEVEKLLGAGAFKTEAGQNLLAQKVASLGVDAELPDNDCFWIIVAANLK